MLDARRHETYPPPPPGPLRRLGATAVAAASVLTGRLLIALRLRRPHEGWRRTVGILLRSESTRFALSAFGLAVPSGRPGETLEARTADGLLSFLSGEADAHFRLRWTAPVTLRESIAHVDVVLLAFAADGALRSIAPRLSAGYPASLPPDAAARVHARLVAAYNATSHLPEVFRVQRLLARIRSEHRRTRAERQYAERLIDGCCLSFEEIDLEDPVQRFSPPAFVSRRTLGGGYLSWIARLDRVRGSVDLWVSAHHVGLDGVPLQDLLNRLEQAWGTTSTELFPEATGGNVFAGPVHCHAPGERRVEQLLTFVDLGPVVELRRTLNTRYAHQVGGDVTLGAVLAWLISQDEEFRGVRIASTVDVAASSGYARDVDVVSLRAADYMTSGDTWDGFVDYVREFNRLIAAARTRTSPVRAGMQTAGLLPAWAHAAAVHGNPAALDTTFGTLCITIIRDARVFIAPMTDLGLGHGFFAIGSATLPTASGRRVTAVSIKGDAGKVAHYPRVLQRVIERAADLCRA